MTIHNYDDWLKLPENYRQRLLSEWNAYEHEMFWVPMMAAARLASACIYPVIDIYVGIYHGGAYVLHLTVAHEHFPLCPKPLQQTFEGFPVVWLVTRCDAPVNSQPFRGNWESRGSYGDYRILIDDTDGLSVSCTDLRSNHSLDVYHARIEGDLLTFVTRVGSQTLFHSLNCDEGNAANYQISIAQMASRSDKA